MSNLLIIPKHISTYIIILLSFSIISAFSFISVTTFDYFSIVIFNSLVCVSFCIGTDFIFRFIKNKSQAKFNAAFFGVTGLRMILIILLIVIYLIFRTPVNKPGIIFMICSYFIYMGFEIRFILHKLRPDLQNQKANENARK
ncbi:MAG: hypothetical protein Q8K70_08725 [Bacteroidota bacterium]|nr:hypothetical protein [Bacteroidota bacterium]